MNLPRLSIWFQVALVAFAASATFSFMLWRRCYVERPANGDAVESITTGMSEFQVRWALGAPHQEFTKGSDSWGYNLHGSSFYLNVTFKDGRVEDATYQKSDLSVGD